MVEIIMNGGEPLEGCPTSWDEACAWQDSANDDSYGKPQWRFDCGFKLDYDGPLVDVESRFYPPKKHYGPCWTGGIRLRVLGEEVVAFKVRAVDLAALEAEVGVIVSEWSAVLLKAIEDKLQESSDEFQENDTA